MKCSIIIPNYNGRHLLARGIPSVLAEMQRSSAIGEVIVVDDGSTDDSVAFLQTTHPEVVVVPHEVNQGFSEAVHTGVKSATGELVFLMNSDVILNPGCIDGLLPYFQQEDTFAAGPLIVDQHEQVSKAGWNRSRFRWGRLKRRAWNFEQALREKERQGRLFTLYCSGGSALVRKSMFLTLGGFDPLYKPFYSEDFDLGLRAWYRGWKSYFEPEVRVVHEEKGTIEDTFKRYYIKSIQRRNRYLLHWRHYPVSRLLTTTLLSTLLQLAGEVVTLDRANLKGFWMAARTAKYCRIRLDAGDCKLRLDEVLRVVNGQQS